MVPPAWLQVLDKDRADSQLLHFVARVVSSYLAENSTAAHVLQTLQGLGVGSGEIFVDHLAFRTFAVPGQGIQSISDFLLSHGFEAKGKLQFPAKHLQATWFSLPTERGGPQRIFVSELEVDKLSSRAQKIIASYTRDSGQGPSSSVLHNTDQLPWRLVEKGDYEALLEESEYAAWTLVNGYKLNHATVSVHRLGFENGIEELLSVLQKRGVKLSQAGGLLKVSPDGMLRQASTVADNLEHEFASSQTARIAGSYLEFAERAVLPDFKDLPVSELQEEHRRDGFETANADSIFESTKETQKT